MQRLSVTLRETFLLMVRPFVVFCILIWVYDGYHDNGEGRFFILLGKSFADTMLELMKN